MDAISALTKLAKAEGEMRPYHKYKERKPKAGGGYSYVYETPTGETAEREPVEHFHSVMKPLTAYDKKTKDKTPHRHEVRSALRAVVEHGKDLKPGERKKVIDQIRGYLKEARVHARNMDNYAQVHRHRPSNDESRVVTRQHVFDARAVRDDLDTARGILAAHPMAPPHTQTRSEQVHAMEQKEDVRALDRAFGGPSGRKAELTGHMEAKMAGESAGHKYVKREGSPGAYKYTYAHGHDARTARLALAGAAVRHMNKMAAKHSKGSKPHGDAAAIAQNALGHAHQHHYGMHEHATDAEMHNIQEKLHAHQKSVRGRPKTLVPGKDVTFSHKEGLQEHPKPGEFAHTHLPGGSPKVGKMTGKVGAPRIVRTTPKSMGEKQTIVSPMGPPQSAPKSMVGKQRRVPDVNLSPMGPPKAGPEGPPRVTPAGQFVKFHAAKMSAVTDKSPEGGLEARMQNGGGQIVRDYGDRPIPSAVGLGTTFAGSGAGTSGEKSMDAIQMLDVLSKAKHPVSEAQRRFQGKMVAVREPMVFIPVAHGMEKSGAPSGFVPIQGSKHGGYHKRGARGWEYWYPGEAPKTETGRHLLTGETYPIKDRLRAMGGKWDPDRKGWWVPGSRAEEALRLLEGKRVPEAGKQAEPKRVAVGGNTFPVREKLKRLGATWDATRKVWMVPEDQAEKARQIVGGAARGAQEVIDRRSKERESSGTRPEGSTRITMMSRHKPYARIGHVYRHPKLGIVKVVGAGRATYISEDGWSFGLQDESGWAQDEYVMPASEEESSKILAEEAAKKKSVERRARVSEIVDRIRSVENHLPDGHVDGDTYYVHLTGAGSSGLILSGDKSMIGYYTSNYDDGPSYWAIPWDDELAKEIESLVSHREPSGLRGGKEIKYLSKSIAGDGGKADESMLGKQEVKQLRAPMPSATQRVGELTPVSGQHVESRVNIPIASIPQRKTVELAGPAHEKPEGVGKMSGLTAFQRQLAGVLPEKAEGKRGKKRKGKKEMAGKLSPLPSPEASAAPIQARKSEFGPDMRKGGLYSFKDYKDDKGTALPDDMLYDYLCAFIEEAYEHEKRECEHRQMCPMADMDIHLWWAKRIVAELVQYVPHNANLMRASKKHKANAEMIAQVLRAKGFVKPATDAHWMTDRDSLIAMGTDPVVLEASVNGGFLELSRVRRGRFQEEMVKSVGLTLSDVPPEKRAIDGLKDDSIDPFVAAARMQKARVESMLTVVEQGWKPNVNSMCPVHGMRDLTKSMNLNNAQAPCIC